MARDIHRDHAGYQLSGFVDGVWHPEDLVELPGTSWIIVSCMRSANHAGALFKVDTAQPSRATELRWAPAAQQARLGPQIFDPHGIAARRLADDTFELLVVDHGGGEAIDCLAIEFDEEGPFIASGERRVQPPRTSANAVAHLPDGGFVMTSMFDPTDRELVSRFARAEPTGQLWRWSPEQGWNRFGDQPMSGANGIAVSRDGFVVACEWAARRVWRLDCDGRAVASVETDFLPDNLRWTADGRLLLAGQSTRPETLFGCEARGDRCPLAFKVVRIDPDSLAIEPMIAMDEAGAAAQGFGGATGAIEVGEQIWVGSFTGRRIGIFSPQSA